MMGYSGWRFSCDRGTLERWHGALSIKYKDVLASIDPDLHSDEVERDTRDEVYFLSGAMAALGVILDDGDNPTPEEFVAEVMQNG